MPKKSVSTTVEQELWLRIERIRKVDRRSQAQVVAWALEKGLPLLEAELGNRLPPPEVLNEPHKSGRGRRAGTSYS